MSHSLSLTCGGLLLTLIIVTPTFSQQKPPQPPPIPKVSCFATNRPETLVTHNADGTAKLEDIDDWIVTCSIIVNDKKVYDAALLLPHPTEFHDAMTAIDEFRRVKANEILLQRRGKK